MKYIKLIFFLVISSAIIFSGCSEEREKDNEKKIITTTFYPIEEITKEIVGKDIDVKVLIKDGAEPHSYEPTPKDMILVGDSEIFISLGGMFEKIENSIIENNKDIKVISAYNYKSDFEARKLTKETYDYYNDIYKDKQFMGNVLLILVVFLL